MIGNLGETTQPRLDDKKTMAFKYQIGFIGRCASYRVDLESILFTRIDELGIDRGQVSTFAEADIAQVDPKAPLIAIFFGYKGADDAGHPCLEALLNDSITIIPVVDTMASVNSKLPAKLHHINAFPLDQGEGSLERLAALVLENLRLLRSERRLFISYKRAESQSIAIQLYEGLDKAGFDVFLNTRRRLIPLTQVRLYVVGVVHRIGLRFCGDCLA
jgi:hypothetical protein